MPTLFPSSDAMVSEALPTKNYGGVAYLMINSGSGSQRRAFTHFPQGFPLGVTILEAELTYKQRGSATGGTRTVTVRRAASKFVESEVAFSGQPAETGPSATRTLGNSSVDGRPWVFDVKALMQEVADGAPWYGFRISSNNSTAMSFYGREAGDEDLMPTLRIVWSDAPAAPTNLAPSGGRSVSVLRPTLRFDFTDVVGNTDLAGVHVQVSTSTSFTTPVADSGELPATLPQWTPTADLTGAQYYWRARTQDGAGIWSPWSDPAMFKRTAKAPFTITNPPPAPDNVVYTPTPEISWTFPGQVAYQVLIVPADDPARPVWDSKKQTSAISSITLPDVDGLLLTPGVEYDIVALGWDAVARESIPEEPAHVVATRRFTFGASSTVAAVTDLVVLPPDPASPFRSIEFKHAAPGIDSFLITVDGVSTAIVDAAAALHSGTTYRTEVRGLAPRRETIIGVAAQDAGITSATVTVPTTTSPAGMWLYSLTAGGPAIQIRGDDPDDSVDPSEETAVFRGPNAVNPMTVTMAIRGPEGNVDDNGAWIRSAQVPDWELLEKLRGEDLGLTRVDLTSRVRIFNTYRRHKHDLVDQVPIGFRYLTMRR